MEISNEKSKVMTTSKRSDNGATQVVKIGDQNLEEVNNFQYLGSIINEEVTSDTEIMRRLAMATGQLSKLNKIWKTKSIYSPNKGQATKITDHFNRTVRM